MIDPHGIPETETFVTHLECGYEGDRYEADTLHNLSKAGKPLLVRYDLDGVKKALTKEVLASRAPTMWRYRELLPVRHAKNITALGEIMTPIVRLPAAEKSNGSSAPLLVKDEGRLPTGSFKARGLVMAVSMAKELGIKRMAMPTNGNAGAAMAAYCRRGGLEAYIFCPEDTPDINVREIALQGAKVWKVNGYIDDCGKIVGEGKGPMGWFDTSTLKEPYRIEGKKTMGLELAEQLAKTIAYGVRVPQAIGDFLILDAVRESGGFAIAVDDDAIQSAQVEVARDEGLLLCPEGAATYAAYREARADGRIKANESCMLFNCATGLKYEMPPVTAKVDRHKPIDWAALAAA